MSIEVAVHDMGSGSRTGPVVAFVHGLEDAWQSWRPLVRHLDPTWRCLALDLPWRAGNDYRWRGHAPAVDVVVEALDGVDEPIDAVIGHSLGAVVVLELLASGRLPVDAAVLLAPFFRRPEVDPTWHVFERSLENFRLQIEDGVRVRLRGRSRPLPQEVLDAVMCKAYERVGPVGFLSVFDQYIRSGALPLASVHVPTLVLAGGADPSLSLEDAVRLAELLPAGRLVREEHLDHFGHVRHAASVAHEIVAFLRAGLFRSTTDRDQGGSAA
ncbi:MAG: alpha/beta hydrolase [Actinobacteria bacterium]|nr:alpha/beta hydrolase [Actinomycetota bacterium]